MFFYFLFLITLPFAGANPAEIKKTKEELSHPNQQVRKHGLLSLIKLKKNNPDLPMKTVKLLNDLTAELLNDSNIYIKLYALMALQEMKTTNITIIMKIVDLLADPEIIVRKQAVLTLEELKPKKLAVHQKIADLLSHENPSVRSQAVQVLTHLQPTNTNILQQVILMLNDSVANIRTAAISILGASGIKNPDVHQKLAFILTNDPSPVVRQKSAQALGILKPPQPIIHQQLAESLSHPRVESHFQIKKTVYWALSQIKPSNPNIHRVLSSRLSTADHDERMLIILALHELNPKDQEVLKALQEQLKKEPVLKTQFLLQKVIKETEKNPKDTDRKASVSADTINQFLFSLSEDKPSVQLSVIKIIKKYNIQHTAIHLKLVSMLTDFENRKHIIQTLLFLKPKNFEVYKKAAELLSHKKRVVRESVLQLMEGWLTHSNTDIRENAEKAVEEFKTELNSQPDPAVKQRMKKALDKIQRRCQKTFTNP